VDRICASKKNEAAHREITAMSRTNNAASIMMESTPEKPTHCPLPAQRFLADQFTRPIHQRNQES
jgi:hypothetical protein